MVNLGETLSEELDELRKIRDELRVQVHLGAAEAKGRFEKLEKSWQHLEGKLKVLKEQSKEELSDIGEAGRLLMGEIRDGYKHLKSLL